jgi:hypothetical protein
MVSRKARGSKLQHVTRAPPPNRNSGGDRCDNPHRIERISKPEQWRRRAPMRNQEQRAEYGVVPFSSTIPRSLEPRPSSKIVRFAGNHVATRRRRFVDSPQAAPLPLRHVPLGLGAPGAK